MRWYKMRGTSLGERGFLAGRGGIADAALGEPLKHPDTLHAGAGIQEQADQRGDGPVARGIAQLAVLAGGTDQLLIAINRPPGGSGQPAPAPGPARALGDAPIPGAAMPAGWSLPPQPSRSLISAARWRACQPLSEMR